MKCAEKLTLFLNINKGTFMLGNIDADAIHTQVYDLIQSGIEHDVTIEIIKVITMALQVDIDMNEEDEMEGDVNVKAALRAIELLRSACNHIREIY